MISYIVKRLFQGILTVWFIATATFFAMHNVPGDPLLNDRAVSDAIRANLESKYGLDQPLSKQYLIYLKNLSQGDFGISFTQENRQVNDIIREHFPNFSDPWGSRSCLCCDRWDFVWSTHCNLPQ